MSVVEELLRTESDGSISFGNHKLEKKSKLEDFEYQGDIYKVKTYNEITKLEKNGMLVYESVPGTSVNNLKVDGKGISFTVEGDSDAQITLEMDDDTEYDVAIDGQKSGRVKTNLGGKLSLSVVLDSGRQAEVSITAET